jgi:hypothetical protein
MMALAAVSPVEFSAGSQVCLNNTLADLKSSASDPVAAYGWIWIAAYQQQH